MKAFIAQNGLVDNEIVTAELVVGKGRAEVLAADLRRANREGYALTSDPTSVPVDGSRIVYRRSEISGGLYPVGILAPGEEPTPELLAQIARDDAERSGPTVHPRDLATQGDIAKRLGVSPSTVKSWRARHPDFPEPLKKLSGAAVWDFSQVKAWYQRR